MRAKSYMPETGKVYENRGGGFYRCMSAGYEDHTPFFHGGGSSRTCAEMQNVKSGWTFIAKGIIQYTNGKIEWDHSVGGYFEQVRDGGEA